MAIDPIGQDSYNGLAVPLYGESVIQQENSSCTVLTIMHSTKGNTGRFIMGMDYSSYYDDQTPSSVITDLAVFDLDENGAWRCVSGSTVNTKMDTSGLYMGTTQAIKASDQTIQIPILPVVTTVAAGTSNLSVSSAASGTLHIFTSGRSSIIFVDLPATPHLGAYYDFFSNTTAAGDIVLDAPGLIWIDSSGARNKTTKGVTGDSSGGFYVRAAALTTDGLYSVGSLMFTNETTNVYGALTSGSTTS